MELPNTKDKISPVDKKMVVATKRRVVQLSLDGDVIATYNSISEAVRKTGINSKSIRDAATGKQNHAGGYRWKFDDDKLVNGN